MSINIINELNMFIRAVNLIREYEKQTLIVGSVLTLVAVYYL